jgi:hypothetical protein
MLFSQSFAPELLSFQLTRCGLGGNPHRVVQTMVEIDCSTDLNETHACYVERKLMCIKYLFSSVE